MKNYKRFIESAEEIRDYVQNPNDIIASYDDDDAIAFGYCDDQLYIGKDYSYYHYDLTLNCEREDYEYPGRLWYDKKLISFYKYPSVEKLPQVLEDIKIAMLEVNDIEIDWDEWRIEIYKPSIKDGEYWDDFESDPVDYADQVEIIPISDFIGSKDVDMNNIPPHLMKPEEKKEWFKKHGYELKNMKLPNDMSQAEYRNKTTKYKYTESFNSF